MKPFYRSSQRTYSGIQQLQTIVPESEGQTPQGNDLRVSPLWEYSNTANRASAQFAGSGAGPSSASPAGFFGFAEVSSFVFTVEA